MWTSVAQSESENFSPTVRPDSFFARRKRLMFLVTICISFAIFYLVTKSDDDDVVDDDVVDDDDGWGWSWGHSADDDTTTPLSVPVNIESSGLGPKAFIENEKNGGETPQKSLTVLTPAAQAILDKSKENCPNWTDEFRDAFATKCGFWLNLFADWLPSGDKGRAVVGYKCLDEKYCHGLGDRLAGIQGALSIAIEMKRPFRVK